jgi:alpha-1,2-mannosyltransferase
LNSSDANRILVICRIEPSKKIGSVLYLAKLLKEKKIKTKINVVGSFEPFYQKYSDDLIKLISDYNVSDGIEFHIDASFENLIELMKKSNLFSSKRRRTFWYLDCRGNERWINSSRSLYRRTIRICSQAVSV